MWVHRRESIQPATSSTQCAWCQERNYLLFHVIPSLGSELERKAPIPRLKQWWRARSYTANDTGQAGWNIGHVRANCQHHGLCKLSVFNCRHLTLHYYVLVLCLFRLSWRTLSQWRICSTRHSHLIIMSWQIIVLTVRPYTVDLESFFTDIEYWVFDKLIIIWQCLV